MKKNQGFTLLELMMVILLMTVMMIATFRTMQEKAAAMQVQRATQDVQAILSGAQEYYLTQNVWPGSDGENLAQTQLAGGGYISSTLLNSPWGTTYSYCPLLLSAENVPAVCPAKPEAVASMNAGFYVYFSVNNRAAASAIASLLPNGRVVSSKAEASSAAGGEFAVTPTGGGSTTALYQVQTYVVMGTMDTRKFIQYANTVEALCPNASVGAAVAGGGGGYIIKQTPVTGESAQVPAPSCPEGWTPQLYTSPSGFASSPSAISVVSQNGSSLQSVIYPSMSAYYVVPQKVMGENGDLLGWNIYTQAWQGGGGGVSNPCGSQAIVNVFTRCTQLPEPS
ncbi:MAG: type II secretion system protein [Gammaproteobacteria bacterium]|nr:type II secretion system protein [Gammaproteobacteria bacterium]